MTNKAFCGLHITLSDAVIDWSLAISIDMIHIAPMGNQILNYFIVSLSTGIIERCLVQVVDLRTTDAHFLKHFEHFE